ncbi:hypothetical protein HMPREF0490_01110 [Lachnospiraceae bacterium 6_1_37FAA]|nr:hypothetical protein HMPREF0490_01110 [Lachnospiraceae bacterium 6_1_37FAA]
MITITQEDYELASRKFYCEVERIHGVGVDENRYYAVSQEEQIEIRKQFGFSDTQKIILCVGELLPNKNQQMVIRAMTEVVTKYPDIQLLFAGNGPEKERIEKLVKDLGIIKNVKMLGYITNLQEYQKIADLSVSCSKREGLPLNIVEAMLTGTPVIASVNRGHRELIKSGENGYLVDSSEMMGKMILELLNDNSKRIEISQNALKYAKKYRFDNVKQELEQLYFGQQKG